MIDGRGAGRRILARVRRLAPTPTSWLVRGRCLRELEPQLATHCIPLKPDSRLAGRSIAQCGLCEKHGATVLAVNRSGRTLATPRGDVVLQAENVLFVIGPQEWEPLLD